MESRHEDHTGDPEENNVVASLEYRRRVEGLEVGRLVGPAKRGERPESRREPGVERVVILLPTVALGRHGAAINLVAFVPHRDAMPEPDLARDAPIAQILDPVEIDLLESLGIDLGRPARYRSAHNLFESGLRARGNAGDLRVRDREFFVYTDEPLELDLRLDDAAAAAVGGYVVRVPLIDLHDESLLVELGDDHRARLLDVLAREFASDRKQYAALIDHLFDVELVPARDLEVDRGMRRCDGHGTGARLHVGRLVFDHCRHDRSVDPFEFELLAMCIVRIPGVVGMHHHVLVAEFRLGAHGTDYERAVLEIVKWIFLLDMLDLFIRNSGLQLRVPIDDAVAAVNETCLVHTHECGHHRVVSRRVHRICIAAPVEA